MAMASPALAPRPSADGDVEAVFYSNVHAACTAPLRPQGAAAV